MRHQHGSIHWSAGGYLIPWGGLNQVACIFKFCEIVNSSCLGSLSKWYAHAYPSSTPHQLDFYKTAGLS
ncbi:hypothetical protein BDA96_02G346900 [Sorghum bicolor]|uniref:Uncharacterized protein n=1 Tax=Sorghum bicolor TaxID=4558 RepID=A0A921RRP7_SORBI|nr:hypothetical protein BDA96_02G346900 [Sorghum bicolor]